MNKRGYGNKTVFSSTEDGVTTQIQIEYNPRTDHIGAKSAQFNRSRGWCSGIVNNKSCATYLGVTVAEKVLSKVFKNVERMLTNNPGYDFVCGRGYTIDVKSSCKFKDQNSWLFNIKRNRIADYFLAVAFDDRKNLNPLHVWFIPGGEVNHLVNLRISVATIDKWSKYELSGKLNKVIACCNTLREM